MRWLDRIGAIVLLATAIAASTAAKAEAGSTCSALYRYRIGVLRNGGRELTAYVCDVGQLVRWLHVTPRAVVTKQGPAGDLSDTFTVTITDESGLRRPIVAEVYPSAANGPVVHVLYKTVFRTRSPNRTWVVTAGWRTLDASEQIPVLLGKLGMFQSAERSPSRSLPALAPTNPSGRPDLVTLVFLLAVITAALFLVRQSIGARNRGAP
jgi:hypothetical protein